MTGEESELSKFTDSAGTPWAGRHFDATPYPDDDGSAPEQLIEALRRFRTAEVGESEVVEAVRTSRLLIPLLAKLAEAGENAEGKKLDKKAELSIVTVAGPDGRNVLPVFTSVETMAAWNPKARPVPAEGTRVALAAASERTDVVVIDPSSPTEFAIRRVALAAIAQSVSWRPSYDSLAVASAFRDSVSEEPAVLVVELMPGDPQARLAGPELIVQLTVSPGLDREELNALLARLEARWSTSLVIGSKVDSLGVTLVSA